MQGRLDALSRVIDKAYVELQVVDEHIQSTVARTKYLADRLEGAETAKGIVLEVAKKTQEDIGKRVSELVDLALSAIFDDPYKFGIEFVQRSDGSDANLWFVRGENKVHPLSASGGGVVDVAALALRFALWSLNKSAPCFILDEPFRNLSADKHEQAGMLLKELSSRLGLQIIMVSHNPDVISGADRVFKVGKTGVVIE